MTFLFLPKLKEDFDDEGIKPSWPGKWEVRPSRTLLRVASSLDTGGVGEQLRTVTSIPSIWARALSVEVALHNQSYPLRDLIIEQWQGMLAALALADVRQFDIKVQYVKLEEYTNQDYANKNGHADPFAQSLQKFLPQPTHALYQLDGQPHSKYNPWEELYVFLWNPQSEVQGAQDRGYRVVGISSPSTLVCPAENSKWTGLPWYRENERLSSPIGHLNNEEKVWLSCWLEEIIQELPKYSSSKNAEGNIKNSRSNITQLLEQFQHSLKVNSFRSKLQHINKLDYFGTQIDRGALELLNFPIQAPLQPSNVRVIPSSQKVKTASYLLLIDPKIHEQWDKQKQEIWIYENKTLAAVNLLKDLEKKKFAWNDQENGKVEWIHSQDLLLEEFYFIDREDALFRTLKPDGSEKLKFEGHPITPLIPLNSRLLDYFTASDLSEMITLEMNGDDFVDVYLSINLSGFEGDSPKKYQYSRTYPLKVENLLDDVPVLEFWPNFQAPDWREYYLFYFDKGLGQDTFSIELRDKVKSQDIKEGQNKYQIHKLNRCPDVITCYRDTENLKQEVGVILQETPKLLRNDYGVKWKVGVDFGTSFTNVYLNDSNTPKRLDLEPRLLQLAELPIDIRDGVLIELFIPDNPALLRLPLTTALSIRPYAQLRNLDHGEQPEPFLDGRIYIPEDSIRLKPQEPYIKTGLKWDEGPDHKNHTELFLKHLALEITALAKSKGVSSIEWFVSYPSAFSHTDKVTYSQIWEDITKSLQQTTGIEHIPPKSNDPVHFRSKSIAMVQYLVDQEDKQLVYATCIDISGSTSEISIIENNQLRYQCSIQLANYHLLTQFMEAKPELLVKLFELNKKDWVGIKTDKFAAKFDVLMRQKSTEFLKKNRQTILAKDPEFQGLLQLMTLGSAGLYYYIGIILRVLHAEGTYKRGEITPVYLGGHGSRIFDWLDSKGIFQDKSPINKLFEKMLLMGSEWEKSVGEITSYASRQPQSEVPCGLVLSGERDATLLEGWDDKKLIEDTLIAGEFCKINGQEVTPFERMPEILDQVTTDNFQIDESFQKLKEFVSQFNQFVEQSRAMKELGLKPIIVGEKEYKEVSTELIRHILNFRGKKGTKLRLEPTFILSLKKLLQVLCKRWARTT